MVVTRIVVNPACSKVRANTDILPLRRVWGKALIPHEGVGGLGQSTYSPSFNQLLKPVERELNIYIQEHILTIEMQMTYSNLLLADVERNFPVGRIPPGRLLLFSLQVERRLVPLLIETSRGNQAKFTPLKVISKRRPGNRVLGLPFGHLVESSDEVRQVFETINRQRIILSLADFLCSLEKTP